MEPANLHHEAGSVQNKNIMKQKIEVTILTRNEYPVKVFSQ